MPPPYILRCLMLASVTLGSLCAVGCASKNDGSKPYVTASQGAGRTVYLIRPMALWLPAHVESKEYPLVLMEGKLVPRANDRSDGVMPAGQLVGALPVGSRLQIERAQGYQLVDGFSVNALGSFEDPASHRTIRFGYIYHNSNSIPWSVTPPL